MVAATPSPDQTPWWTHVLMGLAGIGVGLAIVVWPGISLALFAGLMGIFLLVHGSVRIVQAFAADTESRVLTAIVGLLAIVSGIIVWRAPLVAAVSFAIVIGIFWIVAGITDIWAGITGKVDRGRGWAITTGLLTIIAGVVLIVWPAISLVTLVWVNGILLIALGAVTVIRGFSVR
jgi:uncharacterized membrane protein HdeD (DUF308 family)